MKDIQGVDRGKCTKCGDCAEYTTDGGGSVRCTVCDHAPTQHEVKGASSQLEVHSERRQLSRPSRPASAGPAFQRATRVTANYEVCTFPGCSQPVEFDLNTGKQWDRCSAHKDAPISSLACVMSSFGLNGAQIGGKCPIIYPIYSNDVMTHIYICMHMQDSLRCSPPASLPSGSPLFLCPRFLPLPLHPLPPYFPPEHANAPYRSAPSHVSWTPAGLSTSVADTRTRWSTRDDRPYSNVSACYIQ